MVTPTDTMTTSTSTETASVAALHEAGHLVAAALRGAEAIYAWIDGGNGYTGFRGSPAWPTRRS